MGVTLWNKVVTKERATAVELAPRPKDGLRIP
jgi:hypothetical protein